jgi:hypothetical protein
MSLELQVYAASPDEPTLEQVGKLLALSGWRWAAVAAEGAPRRAPHLNGCRALGWDPADGIGAAVQSAVAAGSGQALAELDDSLSEVAVEIAAPCTIDADALAELREEGHAPALVARIERAVVRYRFSTAEPATEEAVEFLWALASAIGVLTDGVLEDLEDGTLLDCTEIDDED